MSNGQTLTSICRKDEEGNIRLPKTFPSFSTVHDWIAPEDTSHRPDFTRRFARARLDQQRVWAEEIVDIANEPEMGIEEYAQKSEKDGISVRRIRKDMLAHRALKIDTRLKALARLNPQLWAERLQVPVAKDNPDGEAPRLIIEGGLPDDDDLPPADAPEPDKE